MSLDLPVRHPEVLWIGIPAVAAWAVAAAFVLTRWRRRFRPALLFSNVDPLRVGGDQRSRWLLTIPLVLRAIALVMLVFALARPQQPLAERRAYVEGIDIMLAVDTSGSMRALDLDDNPDLTKRATRLEVARDVIRKFVRSRTNDQIGMVVFGEVAFTQCPLTLDHGVFDTFTQSLEVGMAGTKTAIGDALGIATKRLSESSAESKVLILLTDGKSNAGALEPVKAAEIASSFGIKIYAIGVGRPGRAPILEPGPFGPRAVYTESDLDEATLEKIAKASGGEFFRAEDASALRKVYARIDELERSELEGSTWNEMKELYPRWLFVALAMLLVERVLLFTRLRTIP